MFFLASGGPEQMFAKQTCGNNVLHFIRFLHHIILIPCHCYSGLENHGERVMRSMSKYVGS